MKVLIAAGGTGGHIYPALAIAEKLKEENVDVVFVGTKEGMESKIVPNAGFRLLFISTGQFAGKSFTVKARTLSRVVKGILDSIAIIKEEKPQAVLGMGSFVSFPAVVSAILRGVPSFLHEQNFDLGLTNRVLFRFVKKIFLSFEETAQVYGIKNYYYTGNPVRRSIKKAPEIEKKEGFSIFVLGGSRGAKSINKALVELLPIIAPLKNVEIYHQTGEEEYESIRTAYRKFGIGGEVFPFTRDIEKYYGFSDLVISRAGSSTLFELASMKKPAILIPYPYSAGKHQWRNARYVERLGGAYTIDNGDLSGRSLYEKIESLMSDRERLRIMGENMGKIYVDDAQDRIFQEIMRYVK
jgi:UDP-N-acetylglucosamine--N-acetylmuramyl-(pentapeptide) pyrophosphoryl-undecaprenol N-acetylglucosamine transferase